MTDHDRPAFAQALTILGEVFGAEISPLRAQGYFDALSDLDLVLVQTAMRSAARALKFFPKPAELRALVLGDDETATERAWIAWKQAAMTVGSYNSLIVRDPALAETLIAVFGGWSDACTIELSPEMWSSKRKEFDRVYRVMTQRGLVGARYLAGITESHNSGWNTSVPVGLIDGSMVRMLSHAEAEQTRAELGQQAGALRQLESSSSAAETLEQRL